MNLLYLQIINLIVIAIVAVTLLIKTLEMEKLIKVVSWPFWLTALLLAGIVIVYYEEKEHNAKKAVARKVAANCLHPNKTAVTVDSTVTCETVHTICDDCCAVLDIKIDC